MEQKVIELEKEGREAEKGRIKRVDRLVLSSGFQRRPKKEDDQEKGGDKAPLHFIHPLIHSTKLSTYYVPITV